jgi:hypothetical protein
VPHINDASNAMVNVRLDLAGRNRLNPAVVNPAQTNCSLCACAGVITHGSGRIVTSGAVARIARQHGIPAGSVLRPGIIMDDPPHQHSKALSGKGWFGGPAGLDQIESVNKMQIEMFAAHAARELGQVRVLKMGDTAAGDARRTLKEAKAYMSAMAPEGFIFGVLAEGHWNFAHAVGGVIQFVDYQADHPELGGKPTVGAEFQEAMSKGNVDESKNVYAVLSFNVKDHFPNGPAT